MGGILTITLKITGINTRPIYINITNKPVVLGRSNNCSCVINDPKCSSTHCEVRLNDTGVAMIKDLGSKNGTFINGSRIKETSLTLGDQVILGDTKFSLEASKMTTEELKLHTSNVSKRKTQIIDINTLELEEPIRKPITVSTKPLEKEHFPTEEDKTLTSILKKIVEKIKS
jgi:pSer/pThr/pTyr-binding forkhead associated (FHA) protein